MLAYRRSSRVVVEHVNSLCSLFDGNVTPYCTRLETFTSEVMVDNIQHCHPLGHHHAV